MDFLLTEKQLKILLEGLNDENLSDNMKFLYDYANQTITKASKLFDSNFKFLLRFGTAIGGLLLPIDTYLKTKHFELSEADSVLIFLGLALTYFFDNKRKLGMVIDKLKDKNLHEIYLEAKSKTDKLLNVFFNFLNSLLGTLRGATEMISYTFLIPIITDILDISQGRGDIKETSILIAKRLIGSGVVVISGTALSELLKKIIERFKSQ